MDVSFRNPVAISFLDGTSWRQRLESLVHCKEPLLFIHSRSALAAADTDGRLAQELARNPYISVLTDVKSNPSAEFFTNIRAATGPLPDTIVAMGGGSVIDLAKILVAFNGEPLDLTTGEVLEQIKEKRYASSPRTSLRIIAIPTTAGTGSELTRWATIWDDAHKKKYSVERDDLYPAEAWIVPELTRSMDAQLTASTGLDALSHAVEAYWSVKSNPIVRRLSARSISEIVFSLRKAIDNPGDMEARKGMCLGSVFAGLAFSQTRTTACHAFSYPLTAGFGIPHGIAVAMTLIPVMRANWDVIQERELFLDAFGCASADDVEKWLTSVTAGIVSLAPADYGIRREHLKELYGDTEFMKERLGNNPIEIVPSKIFPSIAWGNDS